MKPTVLVGLSGGVDSAACCRFLADAGYDVTACFLRFFDESSSERAEKVAEKLGVKLYICDKREEFQKNVVDYFVTEYTEGRTPNPCARCNRTMKFHSLIEKADELGIDFVATGHYAGVSLDEKTGRYYVSQGTDATKDQSYFLWQLTQEQLSRVLTPLAGKIRADIKVMCNDVVSKTTKESNEICFIPNDDYIAFIEKKLGNNRDDALYSGNFISIDGKILGRHKGIYKYTVGQRSGLDIALGQRAYVLKVDAKSGDVTLGFEPDCYTDNVTVGELNFSGISPFEGERECTVKLRYRQKPIKALVTVKDDTASVRLHTPTKLSSKGQSAVFYEDERLIFGGVIK